MVQGKPLVSVVMATHNGSRFIKEAARSVLGQTYKNFELVVIDDASTDGTRDGVKSFADERIKVIHNDSRLGLTKSLNRGIGEAQGEFIARIDDDDVWPGEDKLERQVAYLQRYKGVGLVGTQNIVVDLRGQELYRLKYETGDAEIRRSFLKRNPFPHSGVMIRRRALDDVGVYDERLNYAQDYELWLRVGKKYELANLHDLYIEQRINPCGVTSQKNMKQVVSFIRTAYRYRKDYPGFYANWPIYGRELIINLFPKSFFNYLGEVKRRIF